jgi:glycosyltransferase involved in cell wall biosynthesis
MHIRFLTGRLDTATGTAAYDRHLIETLAARGHRVSVIARAGAALDLTTTVDALPVPSLADTPLWRFDLPLSLARGGRAVRRLSSAAPDITIATEHLFLRGHARKFRGRPWVYFPHDFSYPEEIERFTVPKLHHRLSMRAARGLQRWAVTHADTTVRLCRTSMEAIMEQLSLEDMSRFTLLTPGSWIDGEAHRREAAAPLRLLLVADGLHPSKRVDLAIAAVLALPPDARWELHIVGDGDDRTIYETQAADDGRILPIHFHGAHDDLTPFYRRCDVLLFPCRLEHMGFVLIDAMKHGLPVLALDSRIRGLHTASNEIIDNHETGWLADSDATFTAALHRLVTDPAPVDPAGARARLVACQRFAWSRHVDAWEEALNEVLARNR